MKKNSKKAMVTALAASVMLAMTAQAKGVELTTSAYSVKFADEAGGYAVTSIVNRLVKDVAFIRPQASCAGFWRLKFTRVTAAGKREMTTLTNLSKAKKLAANKKSGEIEFVWSGMSLPGSEGAVEVVARVAADAEDVALSDWRIEVKNTSKDWALFSTDYPLLASPLNDNEGKVLFPSSNLGAQYAGKAWLGSRPYFHSMPMIAAYDLNGGGLLIAARDGEARIKETFFEKNNTVMFRTVVENAGVVGRAANGPKYKTTLAVYAGDWWQAAKIHRRWALKQYWAKNAAMRLDKIAPHWLNIHGSPKDVRAVLTFAKKKLPEFSTGIHWHLWQNAGHDINYPEYFPAQTGTKDVIKDMRAIGQVPMLYINGRRWSSNLQGFQFAKPYAVKELDGKVHETIFAPAPALASMCPSCPEWHGVVSNLVYRMLNELDAPAVFLDEIGNEPCVPCYDATHGHPLGGGRWWADGCRATLKPCVKQCHEHGAFLTTEGSTEALMDLVDGMLVVSGRAPEEIPWYTAVYSGYATYFGSPSHPEDTPESFWMLQARETLRGIVIGWYNIRSIDNDRKAEMINRLCRFRREHVETFMHGELMDEYRPETKLEEVTGRWIGRSTAPKQKAAKGREVKMPAVIGTIWRKAAAKEEILFLANVSDKKQIVRAKNKGFSGRDIEIAPYDIIAVEAK